jgi:tetraacyldisaccharide 4'-kinase
VLQDANVIVITRKAVSAAAARTVSEEVMRETQNAVCAAAALNLGDFADLRSGARKPPPNSDIVALCAIADPSAFATQLGAAGLRVAELFAFDDHHEYTRRDLQLVKTRAHGRSIVTTEKDAVKIRKLDPAMEVIVVGQQVKIEEGEMALLSAVQSVLR